MGQVTRLQRKIAVVLILFVIVYGFWLIGGDPVKNESGDVQVTTTVTP